MELSTRVLSALCTNGPTALEGPYKSTCVMKNCLQEQPRHSHVGKRKTVEGNVPQSQPWVLQSGQRTRCQGVDASLPEIPKWVESKAICSLHIQGPCGNVATDLHEERRERQMQNRYQGNNSMLTWCIGARRKKVWSCHSIFFSRSAEAAGSHNASKDVFDMLDAGSR